MAAKPNAPLQTLTENQKLFLHDLSYLDRSALSKRTIKSVKTKKCAINATSPICMRSQSSSSSNIKTPLVPNKSRSKSIIFNANSVKLQKISERDLTLLNFLNSKYSSPAVYAWVQHGIETETLQNGEQLNKLINGLKKRTLTFKMLSPNVKQLIFNWIKKNTWTHEPMAEQDSEERSKY